MLLRQRGTGQGGGGYNGLTELVLAVAPTLTYGSIAREGAEVGPAQGRDKRLEVPNVNSRSMTWEETH